VVIDGTGKYLIPGLINLHVHINRRNVSRTQSSFRQGAPSIENSSDFHRVLYAARNAWYELSQGVTTLRDLCSVGRTATALREAIKQKIICGPRLYVCGMGIAATGGHETHRYKGAVEVDGCDEILKAVRNEIKLGADFIKVMSSGGIGGMPEHEHPAWSELSTDEIKSACDTAHSHNKKVTVHAMGALPVLNSLVAGVDGIEHGACLTDEALDIMKSRGVYYVPTASGINAVAEKERKNGNTHLADIICEEVVFPQLESINKAYENGILIGAGTDTLGNMCDELLLLEKAGLSTYEALQCATINASKIVENDKIGTIECGKIADLVLLDANPLDDLKNIRKVNIVVFEGEIVNEKWMCNLQ
jgi:imidazolonepropionase-like amidohydrolase